MEKKSWTHFLALFILTVPACLGDENSKEDWVRPGISREVATHKESCMESVGIKDFVDKMHMYIFLADVCGAKEGTVEMKHKCFVSCILNRMNILKLVKHNLTKTAQIDTNKAGEKLDEWRVEEKEKPNIMQKLQNCAPKQDPAAPPEDKCDTGYNFIKCVCTACQEEKEKMAAKKAAKQKEGQTYN